MVDKTDSHTLCRCIAGDRYEGSFNLGKFHGRGTITFAKNGGKYTAEWVNGEDTGGKYEFKDGLDFQAKDWNYCTDKDRRFFSEVLNDKIPSSGATLMSDTRQPTQLPVGCYDVVDGYYDPATGKIHSYETKEVLRTPTKEREEWIKAKCRVGSASAE